MYWLHQPEFLYGFVDKKMNKETWESLIVSLPRHVNAKRQVLFTSSILLKKASPNDNLLHGNNHFLYSLIELSWGSKLAGRYFELL